MDKITQSQFKIIRRQEYQNIIRKVNNRTYRFTRLKEISVNNRVIYIPTIRDKLVLEYVKDRISEKYKIHYPNRNNIIDSIKNKFTSDSSYYIIRLDIQNFFPSIPQNKLLQKLKENGLLSSEEYFLVKQALKVIPKGVPQGLSISNVLAEIYLEGLDYKLKRQFPTINYYSRYVDDILIILNGQLKSQEELAVKQGMMKIFDSYSLKLNSNKMKFIFFPSPKQGGISDFEYLGYKFETNNERRIYSISQTKIDKFKSKIDACFCSYRMNCNFNLLIERLTFLLSKNVFFKREVYISKKNNVYSKQQKIYFGIIENYKLINNSFWEDIDKYIKQKISYVTPLIKRDQDYRKHLKMLYSLSIRLNKEKDNTQKFHKLSKDEYIRRLLLIDPTQSTNLGRLQISSISEIKKLYFKKVNIK